jgi:DNA-binding HxlR family transcriptional regulator
MKRTDTSAWPCNIARGAHVLGDHWNVLLIRQACLGTRRFEDFQRTLGIGRNMLTLRLNGLVGQGILDRVEYQTSPLRFEYRLTDKGREAYGVLASMAAWAERWMLAEGEPTPVVLHHIACDHDMHAVVVCSECRERIDVRQVIARPGPGAVGGRRS